MNEQLYVIEVLLIFILIVLLALLCTTAIFLQPVVVREPVETSTDYESMEQ